MKKYLYLIKKAKIKSWLKFWLLTNKQFTSVLSEILEGFSFNLQNTVKRYFKIFQIFGNSVQDGTPSPENPVDIHSVADDVNLLDASKIANTDIVVNDNGKTIIMPLITSGNGNKNTATKLNILCPDLQVGDVIYIRFKRNLNNNRNHFIYLYGSNKTMYANENSPSYTITQEDLNSYVFLYGNDYDYGETEQCIITDFKIQKNTIPINYSPYNQGTVTIKQRGTTESDDYTFQTEPLRSLPNGVKDTIEDDGIHRRVGRIVLDGTEDWYYYTETGKPVFWIFAELYNINYKQQNDLLCLSNYFEGKEQKASFDDVYNLGNNTIAFRTTLTRLVIRYDNITNVQDFQNWLSNHNTEVLYPLAEEVIESYTEEQQEQYNKIKELYTFDGTTYISSSDEVPPYLKIQYYMKGE